MHGEIHCGAPSMGNSMGMGLSSTMHSLLGELGGVGGLSVGGTGMSVGVRKPKPLAKGEAHGRRRASEGTQAASSSSIGGSMGGQPVGMERAKVWSDEVEDAYRLQEAGYRDIHELLGLGQPEPERWAPSGFIKKLRAKTSLGSSTPSLIYFSSKPECQNSDLNGVKLYHY